jgi:hypothetical protein
MVLSILGQGFNSPHLHQFNLKNGIITKKRITVKTSNENDNRFTKDVLLRQIFQEISNENREIGPSTPLDDLIPTPENASPKKSAFLKWIVIIIFVVGVAYLWFYTVTEVTQDNEVSTQDETYIPSKPEQPVKQKEVHEIPEVLKKDPKKTDTFEEKDSIQLIVETPPKIETPKTEREKAKEALLMQMQN